MNIGGPAIQVSTLMNYLPKDEIEQMLVTGICEPGEMDYLDFNNIELNPKRVQSLGRRISLVNDLKAMLEIRSILKSYKPDILHTHTFKAGLLGRLAALSCRTRPYLVHTFHGHLLEGYLEGTKLFLLKLTERILARKTDRLISVGEKVMKDLLAEKIGSARKFEKVSPGFAMPFIREADKFNHSISDRFICAWVGRLVDIKAPERILEIARLTISSNPKVEYVVVGDGPLRSRLEEQSRVESLPISFLGWTADVFQLLRKVNLLLLTSISEGTPISVIEAQKMGVPVISTNVGSVREVISVGKSGFVIPYAPSQFARLINEFATDKNMLDRFSQEAASFSEDKFSPERIAEDYLKIYKSLMFT
jgi:glycosyltransferase involved in cell wall biosynthesis